MSYDDLATHYGMLKDVVRTEGYRRAIGEVVQPGSVVVDLGCGTGILSVFAARAGASRVYAIERAPIGGLAEKIFKANDANVTLLRGRAADVSVPERVDVLVSEWMGFFLFHETMFEDVVHMRDRVLAENGVMLPSQVRLFAALVENPVLLEARGYFAARPYDVDFSPARDWLASNVAIRRIDPKDLCTEAAQLAAIDMQTCGPEPPRMAATFKLERDAEVHGICGWFDTQLSPSHAFDTGPSSPPTHWQQMFFPFRDPVRVPSGAAVSIAIRSCRIGKGGTPAWQWTVETGATKLSHDDFMHKLPIPG
jgi:hypothetical protein